MEVTNPYVLATAVTTMVYITIVSSLYVYAKCMDNRQMRIDKLLQNVRPIMDGADGLIENISTPLEEEHHRKYLDKIWISLDKVLELQDNHPLALHYAALYHYKIGNNQVAEKRWKQAVLVDPSSPITHNHLGDLYFEQRSLDKAARHYKRAIHIDKTYAPPRVGIGDVKFSQGHIYSAMGSYSIANKLDELNARALFGLGRCYQTLNRNDKAIECYEKAYIQDRCDIDLNARLCELLMTEKHYKRAGRIAVQTISLYPNDPGVYKRFGDINLKLGREKEAVEAYTHYLRIKCNKERLTKFAISKFQSHLQLEILSSLLKKKKQINYAMFIKQLHAMMAGYLINRRYLGALNRSKKRAYLAFSRYFIKDVLLSIAQEKSIGPIATAALREHHWIGISH